MKLYNFIVLIITYKLTLGSVERLHIHTHMHAHGMYTCLLGRHITLILHVEEKTVLLLDASIHLCIYIYTFLKRYHTIWYLLAYEFYYSGYL